MAIQDHSIEAKKTISAEKTWPQVLAILIGSLGNLTCGALLTWTSPFILKISRDKEHYNITEDEASYFTVLPPISLSVGSIVFTNLNDVFGRKPLLLFIAVPYIVAWILLAVAKNVWVFYASRLIGGLSDSCLFSSLPMYIGEISTPKVRGTWGNAMTVLLFLGQFFIVVAGSYLDVQTTSYIFVCFPIAYLVLISFAPESPYYYVMKGRYDDAKATLRRFRRKQDVETELEQLKMDVERQMSESGSWRDLFTIGSNRKALYAGIFLRTSQQFSGITPFILYTHLIFEKAGGSLDSNISSIIFLATITILNIVGSSTLEHIGKKRAYIVSSFFCGVVLLLETIYFYVETYQPEIDITFLNWIPLTGLILYLVFYSIGLGLVPTLMLGELFSASIKVKGLTFLNVIFGLLMIITARVFYVLNSNVGLFAPFLLYTLVCFLSSILSFYLVPETKGKTLEDIQQSLKTGNTRDGNRITT